MHQNVWRAVINDINNFAPSIFQSLCELCEFVGDCFEPQYFSLGAMLPQKNTSVKNSHLRIHTMTSKRMVHSYYRLTNQCSFRIQLLKYRTGYMPFPHGCQVQINNYKISIFFLSEFLKFKMFIVIFNLESLDSAWKIYSYSSKSSYWFSGSWGNFTDFGKHSNVTFCTLIRYKKKNHGPACKAWTNLSSWMMNEYTQKLTQ